MNRFGKIWVRLPETPRRGEILEVRTLIVHPMESGFRLDNRGKPYPRHIVTRFSCTYGELEVFRANLHPAVSRNPYFTFNLLATQSAELIFTWEDDETNQATHRMALELTG